MNSTRMPGGHRGEPLGEHAAVDLGHHDVGQQQVDAARVLARTARAASSASGADEHLVAAGLEHQPHELAHARRRPRPRTIVSVPRSAGRLGGRRRRRAGRLARGGQVDLERRAAARLAVDVDAAAALLDDAEHRREPEPGARARRPWW